MRGPLTWALVLLISGMVAASAFVAASHNDDHMQGKILVCHVPPGNPDNAHTIMISENAWPAHEAHGDTLGECAGDDDFPDAHKVAICHVPPGNPENAHIIVISENAVDAHLEHGDHFDLENCPTTSGGGGDDDDDDQGDDDQGDDDEGGDQGDDDDRGPGDDETGDDCVGVVNIRATHAGQHIHLTWDAFTGADEYLVLRGSDLEVGGDPDDGTVIATLDGDTTSFLDTTTEVGVTYTYSVIAVVDGMETEICECVEITAIPNFPTMVAGLLASIAGLGAYVTLRRRP